MRRFGYGRPGAAPERSRAAQERRRAAQERPGAPQERSKGHLGAILARFGTWLEGKIYDFPLGFSILFQKLRFEGNIALGGAQERPRATQERPRAAQEQPREG